MRSRVLKRSIEDVGDTVKTLFAIQEEVVSETQVQQISTPIGNMEHDHTVKLYTNEEVMYSDIFSFNSCV
jgi:ribosomal protein S24E